MTPHIEAVEKDIAKLVLMPGDPIRAKYIADNFLTNSKLVNNVRGMTAYTGYYGDTLVTVFPSGMGIPSMGIYSYELFKFYDVDLIIRIGSMGAYDKHAALGDVFLVNESYSLSSYAKELMNDDSNIAIPTYDINYLIKSVAISKNINLKQGNVVCLECFYDNLDKGNYAGAEMESFALFKNAQYLNKKSATLLTVSDLIFDKSKSLTPEERATGLNEMIELALDTLKNYK